MAEEQKTQKLKTKKPTAVKRILQSNRKRLKNTAFKSKVKTAIKAVKSSVSKKESKEMVNEKISAVYSLMDRAAKKGIFKKNKVARIKSKMHLIK